MDRVLVFDPRAEMSGDFFKKSPYTFYIKNDAKEARYFLSSYSVLAVIVVAGKYPKSAIGAIEKRNMPFSAPMIVICSEDKISDSYLCGADAVFYGSTAEGFSAVLKAEIERFHGGGKDKTVSFGDFSVSLSAYKCEVSGKIVRMPKKEIEVLYALAKEPERVFSRNELLDEVWGVDFEGDPRTVDVHIARVRKKIEAAGKIRIETVPRAGYRFCV